MRAPRLIPCCVCPAVAAQLERQGVDEPKLVLWAHNRWAGVSWHGAAGRALPPRPSGHRGHAGPKPAQALSQLLAPTTARTVPRHCSELLVRVTEELRQSHTTRTNFAPCRAPAATWVTPAPRTCPGAATSTTSGSWRASTLGATRRTTSASPHTRVRAAVSAAPPPAEAPRRLPCADGLASTKLLLRSGLSLHECLVCRAHLCHPPSTAQLAKSCAHHVRPHHCPPRLHTGTVAASDNWDEPVQIKRVRPSMEGACAAWFPQGRLLEGTVALCYHRP